MTRRQLVPAVFAAIVVTLVIVFHSAVLAWFGGKPVGGGRAGSAVTSQAGALKVSAALDPDPPRQNGSLVLTVTDAAGKPVDGAHVTAEYDMAAMGAMGEMKGAAKVASEGDGRYRVDFELPMTGTWGLNVAIETGGPSTTLHYRFATGAKGLTAEGAVASSTPAASPSPAPALTIAAALDPDPPQQHGALVLTMTDKSGRPIESAHATAEYRMPAMAGMQEMKGTAKVTPESDGRYRVEFDLPMAGTWYLDVVVDCMGGSKTLHYRITVGQRGVVEEPPEPASIGAGSGSDVAYYTCSMHTSVRSETPGTCPLCSMPLKPVTKDEVATGIVTITQDRRDAFGIRVAPVVSAPMHAAIRTVGKVAYDETKLSDVTLRLKGWITHLDVDATGQQVRRGQRMLTLYSPDLYAAEQEYLLALASGPSTEMLANAAKRKLELWGLTDGQIADIAKRNEALQDVPIVAPASGYVIEKDVVEGAAVDAGMRLFRIAALDEVWVEAELFEGDLPLVKPGQLATITMSYLPGRAFTGKVAFVYPYLDPQTRTGRVRIALPNKDLALKPDMYANAALDVDLGTRLQVPISSVVYTGTRRIVLVDRGDGKIQPVEVQLGARTDDMVEVKSGLTAGQNIVVAGNFLVAAESRIRAADFWAGSTPPAGSDRAEGDHVVH